MEIVKRKERSVSSLARIESRLREVRDVLMSSAFRMIDSEKKETILSEIEEVISQLEAALTRLSAISDRIKKES